MQPQVIIFLTNPSEVIIQLNIKINLRNFVVFPKEGT